jgi:hypothetical protein
MTTKSSVPIPIEVEIPAATEGFPEKLDESPRIEGKYAPSEEASQLPPGAGGEGDDAIAYEPSVFDDPELRKYYWPRPDYENIHRFFPDFKWTVGEEKK